MPRRAIPHPQYQKPTSWYRGAAHGGWGVQARDSNAEIAVIVVSRRASQRGRSGTGGCAHNSVTFWLGNTSRPSYGFPT
eukprot:4326631-Prymnesium_polylepis.1